MNALVSFDKVGKRYRRGRERSNLRAAIPGNLGRRSADDSHWAVRDLSFELQPGRSLGLIGPNGAGKSTTLKLVAGVIGASAGTVRVKGKTASLIELGAGFHPDMTGRENVQFSAAVLGMGPKTLRRRFDEIVEFADIGAFLDTPVKRYSSGMLARLGFGVATHLDAEVLVLDEVLAVGDAAFQRRCHARIARLCREGTALLYVTHALWTLPMLCDEAILLVGGEQRARGAPVEVVLEYERHHQAGGIPTSEGDSKVIRALHTSQQRIDPGDPFEVTVDLDVEEPSPDGHVMVMLTDAQLKVYAAVSSREAGMSFAEPGPREVHCRLEALPMQPGEYHVYVAFVGDHRSPVVDDMRSFRLEVIGNPTDPAYGAVRVPATWSTG
ncbi:MAG: polysaccharide ABC transporter ATP-binding protein [Acidimicrobiales bacterium]